MSRPRLPKRMILDILDNILFTLSLQQSLPASFLKIRQIKIETEQSFQYSDNLLCPLWIREEHGILPEVKVTLEKLEGDEFNISVEDNGPGIERKQVPNVFGKLLYGSRFFSKNSEIDASLNSDMVAFRGGIKLPYAWCLNYFVAKFVAIPIK